MYRPVKDPQKYVYHYTTCETTVDYILKNGDMRFSPFIKTNDPRETKSWTFKIKDSLKLIQGADSSCKLEMIQN